MSEENQSEARQLSLFPTIGDAATFAKEPTRIQLSPETSLNAAIGAFDKYMQMRGFTENTQQAFTLDLQLLSEYLGPTTLDEIGPATLNAFLRWMESGRGVPCSPKTLERRITTLKVFFGWLAEEAFLPRDVAAPLIHRAVSAPLPKTLTGDEIAALMTVTQEMRRGRDENDPDARPHLLLLLLLNTGIKKSECVNIHLNHLDLADKHHPAVWIRYRNARRRHKERRITLPSVWPPVLNEYLSQYPTQQLLFPWTGRNLEYVLTGVAETARVSHVTFEILRWTCALRDYIDGMDSDALRRKMGLSEISWYEVENRLDMLARLRAGYSRSDPE
jgi:integrase/recombinase XerD